MREASREGSDGARVLCVDGRAGEVEVGGRAVRCTVKGEYGCGPGGRPRARLRGHPTGSGAGSYCVCTHCVGIPSPRMYACLCFFVILT